MRHVELAFLESTLRRGSSLEQFMGAGNDEASQTIKWLELRPTTEGIEIWSFEAPDVGSVEFTDIYEFGADDIVEPVALLSSEKDALAFAHNQLGALPEFWVNATMAGDEYLNFVAAGRSQDWRVVRT